MNQQAHAGDDEQHNKRELIEQKRKIGVKPVTRSKGGETSRR